MLRGSGGGGGLTEGTTPIAGGTDTQVQFNDAGVINGSAGLTFTKGNGGTTSRLTLGGLFNFMAPASATLQFGLGDVDTAPVAQMLRTQGTLAGGTSNVAGANFTIGVSPGKGTGVGGSFIVQVAPAGSTGSSQNALVTALTIDSTKLATFADSVLTNGSGNSGIGFFVTSNKSIGMYAKSVGMAVSANALNADQFAFANGSFLAASTMFIGFTSAADVTIATADTKLFRDAANTLAQRNGTTAQVSRWYSTFTDASNGAWAELNLATVNTLIFGSTGNGTGAATVSKLQFNVLGVNKLDYGVTTASTWTFADTVAFGTSGIRINQTPAAIVQVTTMTLSSGADGAGNIGHRVSINLNGTTYWIPCSTTAF